MSVKILVFLVFLLQILSGLSYPTETSPVDVEEVYKWTKVEHDQLLGIYLKIS